MSKKKKKRKRTHTPYLALLESDVVKSLLEIKKAMKCGSTEDVAVGLAFVLLHDGTEFATLADGGV